MDDDFTLTFGLDVDERRKRLAPLSPEERQDEFVREQVRILLRYVTLYQGGRRVDPDAFAIMSEPDRLVSLAS